MVDRTEQSKALASDSRMEILLLLKSPQEHFADQESADPVETGVCMHMIADKIGVKQPTLSRHIDILKAAGFVKVLRQQRWSYCSRNEESLRDYHRWLAATVLKD